MSAAVDPVDAILDTIKERGGTNGTDTEVAARFADLSPSELLAALYEYTDNAVWASQEAAGYLSRSTRS
jgi:hypothetical protein